jgi:sigma-B regulation protein RsbU (phosphoserine phosphatase)
VLLALENIASSDAAATEAAPRRDIVVLLIDDQPILARAMKEMLRCETDVELHYCPHALNALAVAEKIAPTVILQDLNMPGIDGLSLLKQFRSNPATRDVPMVVLSGKEEPATKAQAFALGASDYLVKLPNRIELIARIRHHARGYLAQLERNEAYRQLAARERQLATQIAEAADHVRSLLPEPIKEGPVQVDWNFVPSGELGGDALGFHWLDERHFVVYLLDVSGHGVGASLLAVSILNVLSHRTLPHTDFGDPAAVIRRLNTVFRTDQHSGHFFTIWYGAYSLNDRTLTYSGAGHPPGLLFGAAASSDTPILELSSSGPPIGVSDEASFTNAAIHIPPRSRLLLYSDGVVELRKPGREVSDQRSFNEFAMRIGPRDDLLKQILDRVQRAQRSASPSDDCSLILASFC